MIVGGFDRTDSSSLRIYSNYRRRRRRRRRQSLHVLEILLYLHGLPGSHVDL